MNDDGVRYCDDCGWFEPECRCRLKPLSITEDVKVQILQAQPGDIVVLSYPGHITPWQADSIKEQAERILPVDVTVVVMDNGGHVDSVVTRFPS